MAETRGQFGVIQLARSEFGKVADFCATAHEFVADDRDINSEQFPRELRTGNHPFQQFEIISSPAFFEAGPAAIV
jgi:hypothetical protein